MASPSTSPAFKSYAEQSVHYFTRAHDAPAAEPVGGPAAWRGADFAGADPWRLRLSPAQIVEIEAALDRAEATGKPTGELTCDDFPLRSLAEDVARWRSEVATGRGFQVVSGVPVERWTQARAERFFWCLGLHMGTPGAQNAKGDLLGHVTDTGASASDPFVRLYETRADIAFHCDAADVVGLLCLSQGRTGGASRIASSVAVHDELLRRRPELAARLYEPYELDVRSEGDRASLHHIAIPPCRHAEGKVRTFFHSDYFRSVTRHEDVDELAGKTLEALDLFEAIAGSPAFRLDMRLEPGDIQWLSNHTVVHARTAYEDDGEETGRRHLLRLWLSIEAVEKAEENGATV